MRFMIKLGKKFQNFNMNNMTRIASVVFITKNGQLLLGKRKNTYGAGDWGLPGGRLEYGEKLIDAAKRELAEELGILSANLILNSIVDDIRQDQHYVHVGFVLKDFKGE